MSTYVNLFIDGEMFSSVELPVMPGIGFTISMPFNNPLLEGSQTFKRLKVTDVTLFCFPGTSRTEIPNVYCETHNP